MSEPFREKLCYILSDSFGLSLAVLERIAGLFGALRMSSKDSIVCIIVPPDGLPEIVNSAQ